jgi:RimJ/RimL family protein N-acetyltransferase
VSWDRIREETLEDERLILRRISSDDREQIRSLVFDPDIWRYFVFRVSSESDLTQFMVEALTETDKGSRIVFCIVQKSSGKIVGSMCYGNISEQERRIEIGWSWLGREYRGIGINHRAKYLLLRYAFEILGDFATLIWPHLMV